MRQRVPRTEQAAIALGYYEQGLTVREIAAKMKRSTASVTRYLTEFAGVCFSRKGSNVGDQPLVCDHCHKKPKPIDGYSLTAIRNKHSGNFEWLCGGCLCPDYDVDVVAVQNELQATSPHVYQLNRTK
jgi:hypothetical protein